MINDIRQQINKIWLKRMKTSLISKDPNATKKGTVLQPPLIYRVCLRITFYALSLAWYILQ